MVIADLRSGTYPVAAPKVACVSAESRNLRNCHAAACFSGDDLFDMYIAAPPTRTPPLPTGPGIGATPRSTSGYWPLVSSLVMVPSVAEASIVMAWLPLPIPSRLSHGFVRSLFTTARPLLDICDIH